MGIVRLSGRDAVRLLTDACERNGRQAWTDAHAVGDWRGVVPAPRVKTGGAAAARHNAPDRTCIRRVPPSQGEGRLAS
jgi:hypothetical protein